MRLDAKTLEYVKKVQAIRFLAIVNLVVLFSLPDPFYYCIHVFFFNLGWEGFLCDIESNECMSAPCQNGAVCIDLHANYECACLFGKLYSVELNNFKAILFIWL